MDYTLSNSYDTHPGTGNRMHEDAKAIPTVWSALDANSIIWSLMELVKAAGLAPLQFDKNTPATYQLLLRAIRQLGRESGAAGAVNLFARAAAPTGWLKANGAAISRAAYADLFAAIGVTFGAGDGSTTFNLPDLRGEFLRGFDDGRGVDGGRAFGSAQSQAIQSHTHTVLVYRANDFNSGNGVTGTDDFWDGGCYVNGTGATGGTETRPRNVALLACIKY